MKAWFDFNTSYSCKQLCITENKKKLFLSIYIPVFEIGAHSASLHSGVPWKVFCQTVKNWERRGREKRPPEQNYSSLIFWTRPQSITLFQWKLHWFCTTEKKTTQKKKTFISTEIWSCIEISPVIFPSRWKPTFLLIEFYYL